MTTYFYNRNIETGRPQYRPGQSSAPHLYSSHAKAAMHTGRGCEVVEVELVVKEKDSSPTTVRAVHK